MNDYLSDDLNERNHMSGFFFDLMMQNYEMFIYDAIVHDDFI